MKKLTTFASAVAIAAVSALPVAAEEAQADPFVSAQGSGFDNQAALIAAGVAVAVIVIALIDADSSDSTTGGPDGSGV